MKFLCRNCKAKYQIADEKVAGRTLRMQCQQCGDPIVVRGAARTTGAVNRPPSPQNLPQPLSPAPFGAPSISPLQAGFQHQMAVPAHELPAPRMADEWHVAINDVPVGPMRRAEVARKIALGAVDLDSLAWREGMDDWLAVRRIPELALLLSPAAPPPPAPIPAPPPSPVAQPAARVEMAPIGGRQVLTLEEYAPSQEAIEAVAVSPLASEPSEAAKPLGWAPMFALVCGGALILAIGLALGKYMFMAPVASAPVASTPEAPPPSAAAAALPAAPEVEKQRVVELEVQAIEGEDKPSTARKPASSAPAPASASGAADKSKQQKQLTEDEKAMLARMGGGLDQGPSNLQLPSQQKRASSGGGTGQLTAQQLSSVVLAGRKNLQRCYETALRGAGSGDTVRMDVEIEISAAGNVTKVKTTGKGLPGMDDCITRTVKAWRFPTSGEATQTRFPVVFQPGG